MALGNIKDLLLKSLNKTGKQNQILSSIIYKSIINDFLEIKKIDITPFVISIKLNENIIFLKTNKPILNAELINIQDILLKNINSKLSTIWMKIQNIQLIIK